MCARYFKNINQGDCFCNITRSNNRLILFPNSVNLVLIVDEASELVKPLALNLVTLSGFVFIGHGAGSCVGVSVGTIIACTVCWVIN